ncbi:hypothetical protein JCGZ_19490 [Jatropha curcas]|uniref:Uncharacterized protein n=1 Tax=Jatropha curcas TaxID=180498 RepID=A0A067LJ59_JATCU|nr:hypothetical protein JCGZ_19490 [Jatropha curcas]
MAFGPAGLFAVRENWLFQPQNLGVHRRPQPLSLPLRAAAIVAADRLSSFFRSGGFSGRTVRNPGK